MLVGTEEGGLRQGPAGRLIERKAVASVGAGWRESSCVLASTDKGPEEMYMLRVRAKIWCYEADEEVSARR
jgi:hypothetical protein